VIQSQISQVSSNWRPSLVYEPIPDRCVPEELESLRQVLPFISVFSPNHEEAWSFYGVKPDEVERRGKDGIEEVAMRFFEKEGANGIVVIRSGAWGAYCLKKGAERGFWVSAYYPYDDAQAQKNVVDVTGAGNSFLVRPIRLDISHSSNALDETRYLPFFRLTQALRNYRVV